MGLVIFFIGVGPPLWSVATIMVPELATTEVFEGVPNYLIGGSVAAVFIAVGFVAMFFGARA